MKLLDEAKQFFWLRRIALANERQADAIEKLVRLKESENEILKHPKPPIKRAEIGIMDQEEINKRYLLHLEADRDGIELDE